MSITRMRTTLSLDDDVLLAVQERARREKRTGAGQVLSDLARQALTAHHHRLAREWLDETAARESSRSARRLTRA